MSKIYKYQKIAIFFILTLLIFQGRQLYAQIGKQQAKYESLIRLAEQQFDFGYYKNAADFYYKAVEISPNSGEANYGIAECNRLLYNYIDALKYYKTTSENDLEKYPLSLFYYALMLKYEGDYEEALTQFENFINKTKNFSPANFENKKAFFQRTLIEMEGCYWSIEQLFEYKCHVVENPLNSEFNDFGTAIYDNDSSLLILSGRLDSKFAIKNDIGEAYTNNFYFKKIDDSWEEQKLPDNLDKINSIYNDGSGVFNKSKTAYYFTSCGRVDSYCKIYVSTRKKEGNWSEPTLLNDNINLPNSDSKHPAISENEDTLFFVSNRVGGYGENDIWFSVKEKNSGQWGEAVNLGSDINTPFNEATPFVYQQEAALFFASDGHKGFGGLDIFIAKKDELGGYSITNIGNPFNSNSDDCYFVLGSNKGYLTSNRDGGIGEFDIYSFGNMFQESKYADYNKKLQLLAEELSKLKYDIEIVKPEIPDEIISIDLQDIYDRVLSAKYAALVYDVKLKFTETDYFEYEQLSKDDKSIIDLLYMADEVNMNQEIIDSIANEDEIRYQNLLVEQKVFVDNLAQDYLLTTGGAAFIKMNSDEKQYYKNLNLEEKQKIDRLTYYRIKTEIDKSLNVVNPYNQNLIDVYTIFDSTIVDAPYTFEQYESLISVKIAGHIHDIDLRFSQSDFYVYNDLSFEDRSMFEMDFKSRAFELSKEDIEALVKEDELNYQLLEEYQVKIVNQIAEKHFSTLKDSTFVRMEATLNSFLTSLSLTEKRKFDRLIAYKLNQLYIDSIAKLNKEITEILPNIDENLVDSVKQSQYQRLLSVRLAGFIYNVNFPYIEPDYLLFETMSMEDKSFIDAIFLVQAQDLTQKVISAIYKTDENLYEKLEISEKEIIDDIAESYSKSIYNSEFVRISENSKEYYTKLNLEEKKKTDRLIAYKLTKINEAKIEAAEKYLDILTDDLGISDSNGAGKLFTDVELQQIDKILSFKLACHINGIDVPMISTDYQTYKDLTLENISILEMMYNSKIFSLKDPDILEALQKSDEKQYNNLPKVEKDFIDRIVDIYVLADEDAQFVSLTPQDSLWYKNQSVEEKYKTDRLVMLNLYKKFNPAETILTAEEMLTADLLYIQELSKQGKIISEDEYYNYERILSFTVAQKIHQIELPFIENDYNLKSNYTIDDFSIIELMLKAKMIALKNPIIVDSLQNIDKDRFENISSQNKEFVNRVVENFFSLDNISLFVQLNKNDSIKYSELSIKEKYQIDRFIALKYKEITNANIVSQKLDSTLSNDDLNMSEIIDETDIITTSEKNAYERILAFDLAKFIYDIDIPYIKNDYDLFQKLSIDELSILDMMFGLKTFTLSDVGLDSIKNSDKIISQQLTDDEKTLIDRIVEAYSSISEVEQYITLNSDDTEVYKNLENSKKFKIDRIVAYKLSEIISQEEFIENIEEEIKTDDFTESIEDIVDETDLISDVEFEDYEKIISFMLAEYIHGIDVKYIEQDYLRLEKMSIDDKSIIDMMFSMRIMPFEEDTTIISLLKTSDERKYKMLSSSEQTFVDNVVNSYIENILENQFIKLPEDDSIFYANCNIEDKNYYDRIIASRLRILMYNPTNYDNIDYQDNELVENINEIAKNSEIITAKDLDNYERIISFQTANYIYDVDIQYLESDNQILKNLTKEDLSIIDMMFYSRTYMLQNEDVNNLKKGDKLLYSNLSQKEKQFIDNIIEAYKNQPNAKQITLNSDDNTKYSNLSILEKNSIDRLIIYKLTEDNEYIAKDNQENFIFSFNLKDENCEKASISANLKSSKSLNVSSIIINLSDNQEKIAGKTTTNSQGYFTFTDLETQKNYNLIIENTEPENNFYLSDFSIECQQIDIADTSSNVKIVKEYIYDTTYVSIGSSAINTLEIVYFDYNSAELNQSTKYRLDEISDFLKNKPNAKLVISGYTDNSGISEDNKILSLQRANSVAKYLTQKNISTNNITINGFGSQNPIMDNSTEIGRKMNRRVQIIILE